ncbi:MAG: two-component sensor histidine kinase [Proteobacteria bacterium]|nr:two-component sensor histidine kinase [Pseudomonadota bacterium]
MKSIRKFLLINLLIAMTITTTLTAIGNYYLGQKNIKRHLDTLMVLSTLSYQALLGDDLHNRNLDKIQRALNLIPRKVANYYSDDLVHFNTLKCQNNFNFQVWNQEGKVLLHSMKQPELPLTQQKEGFVDIMANNKLWRVFAIHNKKTGINTALAERHETREQLGKLIAKDDIYITLFTFPLSGLLIWIIIGRGLSSLNRVAKEVSNRAPSYLEPVNIRGVPAEIKPVVDEINMLFHRLQQALEREKRFASDAAHELRTPLAALKTQAQVALKTEDLKEREIALQNVIASVDRSTHIVQQLLTLSRLVPEASHIDDSSEVNIAKLSAEVIARLAPTALDKQIDIELIAENEDLTVYGNATALSILIRNLVDNAIRYTPESGFVRVVIDENSEYVILRVIDNGPGIPAELRARVFERFFRVLGNQSPGSGLGLAIVKQIAKLHHAEVTLGTPINGIGLEVEVAFPKEKPAQTSSL